MNCSPRYEWLAQQYPANINVLMIFMKTDGLVRRGKRYQVIATKFIGPGTIQTQVAQVQHLFDEGCVFVFKCIHPEMDAQRIQVVGGCILIGYLDRPSECMVCSIEGGVNQILRTLGKPCLGGQEEKESCKQQE